MTDPIAALPPLRDAIAAAQLTADKRFGQNFLLDLNLTRRIARAAGDLSCGTTVEIGPGPGGLTRALLLEGAAQVVAVEKDPRCVVALAPLIAAAAGRLSVLEADALTLDATTLGPAPRRICANLPYNVGTALLIGWLKQFSQWESLTLLFQREVAERLRAPVASEHYGRLSVLTQLLARPEKQFDIGPQAFSPPPKVTSTLIRLTPRADRPDDATLAEVERLTAAAFGQRRKMLRQSLKIYGARLAPALAAVGLPETARAEEISPAQFQALATCINASKGPESP